MKFLPFLAVLVCAAAAFESVGATPAVPKTPAAGPEGTWKGTLKIGTVELRLVFHLARKGDRLAGTLDSIDQAATGMPFDEVDFKDGVLRLGLQAIKAGFEGRLQEGGAALEGKWKQSGLDLPLTMRRTGKAEVLARPQHPKKPYPYRDEEVRFENKKAGVKFAGTLTLPNGEGPFPAVVLLSGSGPQDRDETIFGHKPFLVLADFLTRRGLAVLRVDDRGVGGSTGDTFQATLPDGADDALAAVAYLKGRQDIDARHIGLVGHSEGALVGPLAAARSKDVAFLVLLAGTGLPGEDVLYMQGRALLRSLGAPEDQLVRQRQMQEMIFGVVRQEKDPARLNKLLLEKVAEMTARLPKEEQKKIKETSELVNAQLKLVLTPWFRSFLDYDPRPTLRKVRVPVLALIGENDLQVQAKENLRAITEALTEGGNKDFTVRGLPNLNHLFQTSKTGSVSEYARSEETFAPAALEVVADWILRRTKKDAPGPRP